MPRVHGIDIVPRRGRGLCRHRASIVGDGVDTTVSDFEANSAGALPSHLADDDVYACSTSLSLDITVNGLDDSHGGKRNKDITSTEAPPESNISGNASDETLPPASLEAATDTTIINASIVQSASTKESRATSFIRPQPRESLDFMEFGSHSFSVQQISHKSSPTCNLNDLHIDSRGPSLEATDEFHQITLTNITTQSLTVQSREIKGGTVNLVEPTECKEEINTLEASNPITESGNLHNIEGTTALTDVHIPRNPASTEVVNENKEQLSLSTRDQGPTTTITDIDDSLNVSNSQWMIRRCSAACLQMETSISPLELAMKTLHAIRCITYDDQFEEQLQHELFALLKNGKRRDLEYVFDVSERASELRDDTKLNDESLREAASSATANDVANDELEASSDNYHDDEIDDHNELATHPPEILPKTSHPQLFNQMEQEHYDQMDWLSTSRSTSSVQSHTTVPHSRRKKRHSNGNGVILQDEMKSSCASTYENTPSREDAKNQADFRTNADDLDMQDDDIWSFLPNIQSTDEMKEDEELPTRRITRSMNVENSDETDNSQPCHESSSQCAGDDIADDNVIEGTETQVIDLNTQVSEVRMKCTDNEHVDSQNSGTNNIQLLNEDQNNEKCIGSSYEDGEVYSMVKMRERSEGKGVVRIIFTGLTPTHKHMQMIETIGAEFVHSIEEAHTATHVIASDGITKLRRTPKLMICICRVAQILSIEWLEQSSKLQCVLDTDDFLLLNDREAEKRYDFSMKTTLRNGILARKRRGGVLGGWSVYICSGVAGNRAPSLKEIHLIIEAGGGQVLKCLVNTDAFDPPKTIVLTSDPSTKSQFGERGVAKAVRFGAKVMSTSLLFHTIITQNLFDIDIDGDTFDDNIHINPATSQAADTVVCTSPVSIASSVSARSHTPVERENARKCSHLPTSTPVCATAVKCNDSGSVHTRGSRVVHLERAVPSPEPKKRKLNSNVNTQATSQMCSISITRQSHHGVLTSIKALSAGNSQAAYLTSILWQEYFNDARKASFPAPIAKNFSNRPRKGVRCLRGRNRSISPLVSCTNPGNRNEPTIAKSSGSFCNHLLMENLFVTWESFILFTLEDRAKTLVHTMTYTSDKISPASHFFPHPTAIVGNDYEKSGVDSTHPNLPHEGLSLSVDAMEGASYEIFGTLQDLFSLHRQHQTSGMIPEQVVAMLSLKAIEAVAAMHSCGIVHNDIGLDSFLVVKRVETFAHNWGQPELEKSIDSWYLQLIGFGNKAAVLNCRDDCRAQHFAHDYQCLANVIHLLITGGVELTLTSTAGTLDFSSKPYIKGNLFLRGALSWCSLFQALLCVGELSSETSHHFRLHYPVDFSNISTSNDERMAQFGWSCRVLQELCDRRVLNDFIDRLCTHNSRFTHPTTDLSKYGSGTSIGRQSFTCYTSSDQTADHLMEIESNLQSGFTALSNRETAFNKAVAKFEQSKIDQQSILRREGDVHMREHDLLRREREHALEMKQLDALKEEIRRTEMRIEQKLQLLKATSSASSTRSIQHNAELENPPRNDNAQDLHEYENNETTPYTTLNSERSFESRSHASHKSATASILEQPLRKVSGHLHKNRIRFTKADAFISPHGSQRKSTTALKERLPTADPSKNAERASQEDFDREIQYSQESTSSSKQKKKGSGRKSPKCSLHFLPRSPQKTPQKVFIDLGED